MRFEDLLRKVRGEDFTPPERLLCLDPGETTGWALFIYGTLVDCGQISSKTEGWAEVEALFKETQPTEVVAENYRVYLHKLKQHTNSEVYTLRLIGVIDYLCWKLGIKLHYQMAATAKGFCKDSKLRQWGFWQEGERHARDAIRHGCYYLLFFERRKR